jgi:hypothetical protein
MRTVTQPDGQLAFDIGHAIRVTRRSTRIDQARSTCRHCDLPAVDGWLLCDRHARALLEEIAEPSEMYAARRGSSSVTRHL